MAGLFTSHGKQFSIDDAFEEDNEEMIRVYGSTTERSPLKPKNRNFSDNVVVRIEEPERAPITIPQPRLKFGDDVRNISIYCSLLFRDINCGIVLSMLPMQCHLTSFFLSLLLTPISNCSRKADSILENFYSHFH